MTAEADALRTRTKKFTLDVLAFVRTLPGTDECRDIAGQLRRSASGVGANYRATCRARSRPEFISRINVALEEADESAFWLEIISEGQLSSGGRASCSMNQISCAPSSLRRASLQPKPRDAAIQTLIDALHGAAEAPINNRELQSTIQ